jgi:hypothetical protein
MRNAPIYEGIGLAVARQSILREITMKRFLIAGFSVLTVAGMMSWKLSNHAESSVSLQDISVIKDSEHTHQAPNNELAGFRIRLSPSDFGLEITAPAHAVPQIDLASN